jgi:hypothetical protein
MRALTSVTTSADGALGDADGDTAGDALWVGLAAAGEGLPGGCDPDAGPGDDPQAATMSVRATVSAAARIGVMRAVSGAMAGASGPGGGHIGLATNDVGIGGP